VRSGEVLAGEKAVVRAEALEAVMEAGISPKRAKVFVTLLDLSGVGLDADGEPDHGALKRAVRNALEQYPELNPSNRCSRYGRAPGR